MINTRITCIKRNTNETKREKNFEEHFRWWIRKYFYNAYLVDSLFSVLIRTVYTPFTIIQLLFHIVPAAVQSFVTWWEEFLSFLLIESMSFVMLHCFFNPFNLTTILNLWPPGFWYKAEHNWWSLRDDFFIYNYNQRTFFSYEMIRHLNLSGLTVK